MHERRKTLKTINDFFVFLKSEWKLISALLNPRFIHFEWLIKLRNANTHFLHLWFLVQNKRDGILNNLTSCVIWDEWINLWFWFEMRMRMKWKTKDTLMFLIRDVGLVLITFLFINGFNEQSGMHSTVIQSLQGKLVP